VRKTETWLWMPSVLIGATIVVCGSCTALANEAPSENFRTQCAGSPTMAQKADSQTAARQKTKLEGVIATRTGETLVVSTDSGNVTVVLTDDTKLQQPKGLGLRKKQMSATVLIPGLRISVDGIGDAQSRVTANTINFTSDDLETAEAIQAGLTPTKHAVAM
jgi:hypothetical protein